MKKISKLFVLTAVIFFPLVLGSCDNGNTTPTTTTDTETVKLDYDMSNVKFEDKTLVYDGNEHTLEITGSLPNGVSVTYTNNKLTEVGTLQVTASFKGDYVKYNKIPDMKATLAIVQGEYDMSNVRFEDKTVVYDGTLHSLEITGTLPEGVTVTYDGNAKTDVGTYEVTAHFEGDAKNYKPIVDMHATLTIVRADYNMSNIRLLDKTVTYNGNPQSLAITGTLPEGVTVTYDGNERTDVGIYEVTAHFEGDGLNYNPIPDMTATLTIEKARYDMSNVRFIGRSFVYDGNEHRLEVTGDLPKGVTVSYVNNGLTDVGSVEVIAIFKGDTHNYEPIKELSATLTVVKGEYDMSNIKFEDKTVTYDGTLHSLEITGTLPEGVTVTYVNNRKAFAGTYEVTAHFKGDGLNYNPIPDMTAILTIEKATYDMSGVTFKDKTVTYDGEFHSCVVEGELPEGVTVYYDGNYNNFEVGVYEVIAHFKGDEKNYNPIPDMKATLRITEYEYNAGLYTIDNVYYYKVDDHLTVKGCKIGLSGDIVLKNEIDGFKVTEIDANAFAFSDNLTSITIPSNITAIGASAFLKCTNLASVVFEEGVTTLAKDTFKGCINLTDITLPNTVESVGDNAFADCTKLATIEFGSETKTFGKSVLAGCTSLTKLTIPYLPNGYIGSIFGATNSSNNNITPASLKEVHLTNTTELADNAFYIAQHITNVTLPENLETIGENAFYNCLDLTEIVIPESVTSIGKYAFSDCKNLTSVVINGNITTIEKGLFNNCSKLKQVTLPATITAIEEKAFFNCNALTDVYYLGTSSDWEKITIAAGNDALTDAINIM